MNIDDLRKYCDDFISENPQLRRDVETIYDNAELDIELGENEHLVVGNAIDVIERFKL